MLQVTDIQKKVWKDFEITNSDKYHDLCVSDDAVFLADVFEICLEIYALDPACFLTAPELAWQAASKKTKVKLHLLIDVNLLLMLKKVLEKEYVIKFINV